MEQALPAASTDDAAHIGHTLEREQALQAGMLAALKGQGSEALSQALERYEQALERYENDADILAAIERVRVNDYGICMAAAATGNVALFKRACALGGKPFDIDESSGDSPFSVALFYMDRKFPGAQSNLFQHLLEIGAMREASTYCLHNMIGAIWSAGIKTSKSREFLQAAIDAGMDPLSMVAMDDGPPQWCPLAQLCQRLDSKAVDCLEWLLESGNIHEADILRFLHVKEDAPAWMGQLADDPQTANRLLVLVAKALAMESGSGLENNTRKAASKTYGGPRF